MEPFDRRSYQPEVFVDGRRLYGQVMIQVEQCLECGSIMVARAKLWAVKGLFRSQFTLDRQMRQAGWRYRYQDTDRCESCTARTKGFACAMCGMDRQPDQAAIIIGESGHQARICRSCHETQPGLLLERTISELRQKFERPEETEESESDLE